MLSTFFVSEHEKKKLINFFDCANQKNNQYFFLIFKTHLNNQKNSVVEHKKHVEFLPAVRLAVKRPKGDYQINKNKFLEIFQNISLRFL